MAPSPASNRSGVATFDDCPPVPAPVPCRAPPVPAQPSQTNRRRAGTDTAGGSRGVAGFCSLAVAAAAGERRGRSTGARRGTLTGCRRARPTCTVARPHAGRKRPRFLLLAPGPDGRPWPWPYASGENRRMPTHPKFPPRIALLLRLRAREPAVGSRGVPDQARAGDLAATTLLART